MEKEVVVGAPLRTDVGTALPLQCAGVFDGCNVQYEYVPEARMQPDTVYVWDASHYLTTPTPVVKEKAIVLTASEQCSPMEFKLKLLEEKEHCIGFKVNDGSKYCAYYFLKSNSLVVFFNAKTEVLAAIRAWLGEHGIFVPERLTSAKLMKTVVEYHNGIPEEVTLPVPDTTITVGCDPEFEIVIDGRVKCAPSELGCGASYEIGKDGAGMQLELRPKAGSVEDVIQNLATLMSQLEYPISTVGNVYPLGGHIHIGIGGQLTVPRGLVQLLDYFLGQRIINLSGSARSSYKIMGACRPQPWGFEYRTPPAAIFVNPTFCRLALKICHAITENYNAGRKFKITPQKPVAEDYINYCNFTPEEAIEWESQIATYKAFLKENTPYHMNCAALWCKDKPYGTECDLDLDDGRPEREQGYDGDDDDDDDDEPPSYTVVFSDTWSAEVQSYVRDMFSTNEGEAEILLYGLAEHRGLVIAGFTMDGYASISMGQSGFGIPFRYRNELTQETRDFWAVATWRILECV